ncbi:MAG: family 65 glycosyl hydrolase [Eubacterium sp.]|nr:family 65 glycosyl hydrolase [Eubacterium sp.]
MAKVADKYFETDQWKIIEHGYNPEYGEVAESIFSLGNEYMGIRGFFEEGYSGKKLIGSYFNGIYEQTEPDYGHYKGIVDFTEYMVNSVNWLYTRVEVDGEQLDLATADMEDFQRVLDLKTGMLTRSFVWNTKSGKKLRLTFERFLSMTEVECAVQKITVETLQGNGTIQITSGLDFSEKHQMTDENLWECGRENVSSNEEIKLSIEGTTIHTGKKVYSSAKIFADCTNVKEVLREKSVAAQMDFEFQDGSKIEVIKLVKNITLKDGDSEEEYEEKIAQIDDGKDVDSLFRETVKFWDEVWKHSDIIIEGDDENQQGIRFCIFQMFQTYHGAVKGTNIGAKGLTGEAYNGNAFWDTETYCLPFFLFNNQEAAKNLLYFRYKTLDEARERAKMLDCKGAFYPIATISGKECCNLWQHASLQLQASTAVAYGIWFYEKVFQDQEFIKKYGLEMLIEICRMLATRGDYSAEGKYGFYCVMGPDEFQMMVNNNCYTNYMAKFTFDYTLKKLGEIEQEDAAAYQKVVEAIHFENTEAVAWAEMSEKMDIPYHEDTKLFEQHEGFFKLPHVEVDEIPVEDFPLYHHWTYDRIYRNDMIKQPDVLMLMLLFNSKFTMEQLKANYEYYEHRCIHESSLSPSVHSILASQLGRHQEAYDFFGFATRMDLDNYNRNTREGLHTTSIAAAWMNIIYGFGGLRTDGEGISLNPSIPENWTGYTFRINYQNETIEVHVTKEKIEIKTEKGLPVSLTVYGEPVVLNQDVYTCPYQA